MEKKKILRIITRLNIGGPARHTILLTEGLNKDKFETILITGRVSKDEGEMLYLASERKVIPVIIPEFGRKINFKNDFLVLWKLYNLINKESPDIIHTHTAKAGALGRSAAILYNLTNRRKKCKLVHTFHGHVLEGYFGRVKTTIFIWIERILAKFTDKIIVVNQRIKEDLLDLGIGNSEKIMAIPLGLELERFLNMAAANNVNSYLKIGIIGRLVPIKNHRMFLEVAKNTKDCLTCLRKGGEETKIKFFIIGDGELRNKLEDYAKELGIQNEIIFTSWQKDLERIYQDLDVVALTSLNEGTPVSLIEAMASAKAVIATDVGGVKDLIGDNERGILVKAGDIDEFSQGLRRLLEDTGLRIKMGKLGRDFVKDRFNKERLINDIEEVYNIILNKRINSCVH